MTGARVVPATTRMVPGAMPRASAPVVFSWRAAVMPVAGRPVLAAKATLAVTSATTPPFLITTVPLETVTMTG